MYMKKIFTLCLGIIAALAVQAQSDFPLQFADKNGQLIADKTVLNLSEIVADDFGEEQVPANLFVKNTTSSNVQAGGIYIIETITGGAFQTCFPFNCVQQRESGRFETGNDLLQAGELKDMKTEWFPANDGQCVVTYTLATFKQNPVTKKWSIDKMGPSVKLNFTYGTAAVTSLYKTDDSTRYLTLQGQAVVGKPAHGVFLKQTKQADGSVKTQKVVLK